MPKVPLLIMSELKHTYWQTMEEYLETRSSEALSHNEFLQELPLMQDLSTLPQSNRRDFLKYLGFSVSAAALAAACRMPENKSIPFVNRPEEMTPGVPNWYASTFFDGSQYCSILVKTRDGRPIKIEGNKMSQLTKGGTSAIVQGSVLSLYDLGRLRQPMKGKVPVSWDEADEAIRRELAKATTAGKKVVILSSTIISPSTWALMDDFKARYPTTELVMYDPVPFDAMLDANQRTFGVRTLPTYRFDKAWTIVGFNADFLGSWLSPVEFAVQYGVNRKLNESSPKISRHIQFESLLTITGASADKRVPLKPSDAAGNLLALHNEVASLAGAPSLSGAPAPSAHIRDAAENLWRDKGASLVVCGINDVTLQLVCNAINNMLGNYGSTIEPVSCNLRRGSEAALDKLREDLQAKRVGVLMTVNCNPRYDRPKLGIENAGVSICFSTVTNETAVVSSYCCPSHHFLESWDDAQPYSGNFSLQQPAIRPLFNTRQWQDSLLSWMTDQSVPAASPAIEMDSVAIDTMAIAPATVAKPTYYNYIQNHWATAITPEWDQSLHDGVFVASATESAPWAFTAAAVEGRGPKAAANELVLYQKVAIGNGTHSDNPWLQEMPDPITRATWDNYVTVSQEEAEAKGWKLGHVVKVSANGYAVELPIILVPGQATGTYGIALGYGRTITGKERLNGIGANAYPFMGSDNGQGDVKVEPTGEKIKLAQTQTHHVLSSKGRLKDRTIIREGTMDNLEGLFGFIEHTREEFKHLNDERIYPGHEHRYAMGHHWKMSIDLGSCIGCGACTIACQAENNVPVVGRREVQRGHDMHWIRIDRYYSGDNTTNPDVVFQPMLCQHCENAPCENVCPVSATNHSTEGLNQMAYNRCVGTRYCANNCPYKVRRFNWWDFLGADVFPANIHDPHDMASDLTRMVLNPDVTVRARGVMEKCSFCVQRIQAGKLTAKAAGRPLQDGDIETACMSACPTHAITFGDGNDASSKVSENLRQRRMYYVIEEFNTRPSVGYLAKVRNRTREEEKDQKGYLQEVDHHHA
jgi:molybdopterin-containing oxidoreductase family iron-sulfur binding subunit